MARSRVTPARIAANQRRALRHGLRIRGDALPASTASEVRALESVDGVLAEVGSMHAAAVWVANELRDAATLTSGDRMSVAYADIAGRANTAMLAIEAGRFKHDYLTAHIGAQATGDLDGAIARQAVITAFIVGKAKRGHEWLIANGVWVEGKPRAVLNYYGEFISRATRNCQTLAALLQARAGGEGDDLSVALARAALENNSANV